MVRIIRIAAAIWTLIAGFLWLMTFVASGFSVPGWVPASGLLAAGVYVVMDVFGV